MDDENTPPSSHRSFPTWAPVAIVALLMTALGLLVARRYDPPPVVPADAPGNIFSAERAFQHLQRLIPDSQPRPLGSPANDRFRERLLLELADLGLDPEENEHWVASSRGTGGTTLALARNIIVELPSSNPDLPALLLCCHHDSVGAGPGASDDGAAVAALLEITGILARETPLPRPVILLFTDGEEIGLTGARGFSRFNETADRVGMVINLEARGSSGGSLMFETSRGNSWIIDQMSQGLQRPMSSSAYVTVYRTMPNSSDLTVFMQRGLKGVNFAFIENPKHYHTPLDNLDNLDQRSLQHHGENVLGMTRQLLTSDWRDPAAKEDAVYTDIAALFIISWPESLSPWFSGAILLALFLPFFRLCREHHWTVKQLSRGTYCWILTSLAGLVMGWLAASALQRLDLTPTPWPTAMHLDMLVPCCSAVMGTLLSILFIRPEPRLFCCLHGLALALGSLVASFTAEGFSYILMIPAFIAVISSLFLLNDQRKSPTLLMLSCLLTGSITTILAVPFLKHLPLALGVAISPPLISALVVLLTLPLLPLATLLPRTALLCTALALALGAVGSGYLAIQAPSFTTASPQQLNITYLEEADREDAKVSVSTWEGAIPPELTTGLIPLEDNQSASYPLDDSVFQTKKAGLSAPGIELLKWDNDNGVQSARIRLTPTLPAQEIVIGLDDSNELSDLSSLGTNLPLPQSDGQTGKRWLRFRGIPEDGLEISLTWKTAPSLLFSLIGISPGLPPHLSGLRSSRDKLPGVAHNPGDRSITLRSVLLESPVF
ncbi:MAG: hypothetical protein CMN03_02335 [Roseibacillus sp.]|nr:hypothetical protein [Roseibacillus sp.]